MRCLLSLSSVASRRCRKRDSKSLGMIQQAYIVMVDFDGKEEEYMWFYSYAFCVDVWEAQTRNAGRPVSRNPNTNPSTYIFD